MTSSNVRCVALLIADFLCVPGEFWGTGKFGEVNVIIYLPRRAGTSTPDAFVHNINPAPFAYYLKQNLH